MKLTKITKLFIIITVLVFFFECNDSSKENLEEKSLLRKEKVLESIENDLFNNIYYNNSPNKFSYSKENLNNFLLINNLFLSKENKTNEKLQSIHVNKLFNYYSSLGYSQKSLQDLFKSIKNYNIEKVTNPIETMQAIGLISDSEKIIISKYMGLFEDQSINYIKFEKITSVFETHVSNSYFSDLEKRNMLTIFNVINNLKYKIENIESYAYLGKVKLFTNNASNKMPDQEIVCAGNIITGMLFGAATGNGVGAAIGLLAGAWADYTAGCFDGAL